MIDETTLIMLVRLDALVSLLLESGVISEEAFEEKCENILSLAALAMEEEMEIEQADS
jgi:hypothetical protein